MVSEASAAQSEALARAVEELCEARGPGVPLRELVELALVSPERSEVIAHLFPTVTARVAVVWVKERMRPSEELLRLLTPRERQVVSLVGEGAKNREIAEPTVKDHVHRALCKLGCESRAEIVKMLWQSR